MVDYAGESWMEICIYFYVSIFFLEMADRIDLTCTVCQIKIEIFFTTFFVCSDFNRLNYTSYIEAW